MKRFNTLFFAILVMSSAVAQTTNLGKPLSWNGKMPSLKSILKMPFVDAEQQKAIDQQNYANGDKMMRFGFEHSVAVDVFSKGDVYYTPSGKKVTRLAIECPGALSTNLVFDKFRLAPHTTLYFYSADHNEYIGAYTTRNNSAAEMLGTELIHSSKTIIEVVETPEEIGKSTLLLGVIVHGYIDLEAVIAKDLNDSGNCEYDVNCPIGSGWEFQRNAVCMLVSGGGFCSGSLVNNTSGTIIPYMLTANHCGTTPGSWVFRFRWESPAGQADCATAAPSVNGPDTMNVNGGILRANYATSDFCLVELNTPPNPNWGIFYNGWDNSGNAVSSATGIHHPSGDIKKISLENNPLSPNGDYSPANSHWKVTGWDYGVTEPGSSGSPLFDENHRTIGQLHGGNSACGGADLSDNYGKFSMSWLGGGTNATQLKYWLDPGNTGATIIDGVDPAGTPLTLDANMLGITGANGTVCSNTVNPIISIRNLGSSNLTSATVTYSVDGGTNQQYTWTGNLATYQIDYDTLSTIVLSAGSHTLSVSVSSPNGGSDQNTSNDTVASSFTTFANATAALFTLHPDCYGSETTWEIHRAGDNALIASGGPYADASSPTAITENICLPVDCYNFIIMDVYGDGMSNTSFSCTVHKGSFELDDQFGGLLCKLDTADANFGTSKTIPFCVTQSSVGIDEFVLSGSDITLYPNPAQQSVTISMLSEGSKNIRVFSATGRLIQEFSTSLLQVNMDLSSIEKGVYFVSISSGQGQVVKKLVKE